MRQNSPRKDLALKELRQQQGHDRFTDNFCTIL